MDRTNWQFGRTDINILVVTVILNGVGLPICWQVLPKDDQAGQFAQRPPDDEKCPRSASPGRDPGVDDGPRVRREKMARLAATHGGPLRG